ncbi:putative porin [Wenzhouxiangella sp. AB-CW3]|uniref:putative porin n=1 Tax=Wenzhouxiangella sp. AB-CW3 TaxID=2771012 RepID=UPI00168B85E9|nr:putative porin [Wenzhouxiangella sp. AB-CW3]QOC23633.1 putative porin [Wenzhouxiangella sp. AB-CW3]
MKKISRLFVGAAVLGVSSFSLATDFNFEAGGSWFDLEQGSAWGGDFTWHFDPVRSGRGPYDQATFLNRSSNLQLDYLRESSGDFDAIGGMLELYLEGFFAGFGASRFSNGFDVDSYTLRGGWMTGPSTRVTGNWDRIEMPYGSNIDILTMGIKHVQELGGGVAFHVDAEVGGASNGSTELAHALRADYYPMPHFGFGLRSSGIGSDRDYGFGTRYFFTPQISGEFEWLRNDDTSDDTIQIRVGARF